MAACSLGGATHIQLSNFHSFYARTPSGSLQMYPISWTRQKQLRFAGLVLSNRSEKPFSTSCKSSSETKTTTTIQKGSAEKKSNSLKSQIIPNSFEVQSLVTTICDTSSIAEFELKLSGFRLYVTRDLSGKSEPPPPSNSVRTSSSITAETHDLNGSVSTPSLAISKSVPSSGGIQTLLDKAVDEGLVILQSPRVGFFRRSRTIKGKRAPLSCKEKQIVKEGQVLCYIEQLGGEIPIESDVSGEIVKILRKDGDPVGYGDPLIVVLPSFPGIKKLQ